MRTTTQQTEPWFTPHCAKSSAAVQLTFRSESATGCDVLMHLAYPPVAFETRFLSYGAAIAICSS